MQPQLYLAEEFVRIFRAFRVLYQMTNRPVREWLLSRSLVKFSQNPPKSIDKREKLCYTLDEGTTFPRFRNPVRKGKEMSSALGASRLLLIIESLAVEPELGITELSKQFGWGKGTVHRLLSSLVEMGYAEQISETGKYQLTIKLFEIGSAVIHRSGIPQVALPVMEDLSGETGETINLAVLDGSEIVYLQRVESMEFLGVNIRIGSRLPAYCTALGKVLLANQSEDVLEDLLRNVRLVQRTPNTITDRRKLREELSAIRERGYALDREEFSVGLRCASAPIQNAKAETVAALSIAGPATRLTEDRLSSLAQLVIEAASSISGKLA